MLQSGQDGAKGWINGVFANVDELDEECKWGFGNDWRVRFRISKV